MKAPFQLFVLRGIKMRLSSVLSIFLSLGFSQTVLAQSVGATAPTVSSETTLLPSVSAPRFSGFTITSGIKSKSTSGRVYEYSDPSGRQYRLRNEYYAGFAHQSGWGASAMAVTNGKTFEDSNNNAFGAGDPSVTIVHPAFFDDGTTKVTGQFRRYFPVTDRSKSVNLVQYAYYLNTLVKLAGRAEFFNSLVLRDFFQSSYKPADTTFVVEDMTSYMKKMNSWLNLGFAQRLSVEWHQGASVGTAVEVYPYADLVLNKNAFIEPRLVLPVYKVGEVYDSARNAALDNAQAELFLQVSI